MPLLTVNADIARSSRGHAIATELVKEAAVSVSGHEAQTVETAAADAARERRQLQWLLRYELVLFPGMFVACAFLVFFTTERGETAIERGSRGLGVQSETVLSCLRVLAFVGFCNVCNLTYITALGVHALYADPWPQMPSWLTNEQCGGATGLACDGDVPD